MMRNLFKLTLFTIFIIVGFFHFSQAAEPVPSSIPSSSDPGLIQKRLQEGLFPLSKPRPAQVEEIPQKTVAPSLTLEKIKFKLEKVVFQGNTVFSDTQLNTIFQPYLNQTISLADLQNLIKEVTVYYRNAGFLLSRAILPPQTIKGGVVTVQVIEGFISEVDVKGNPGLAKSILKQYGGHLLENRPFEISLLERDMLLMNVIITPSGALRHLPLKGEGKYGTLRASSLIIKLIFQYKNSRKFFLINHRMILRL